MSKTHDAGSRSRRSLEAWQLLGHYGVLASLLAVLTGCAGQPASKPAVEPSSSAVCADLLTAAETIMRERQQGTARSEVRSTMLANAPSEQLIFIDTLVEMAFRERRHDDERRRQQAVQDFGRERYESCTRLAR